MGGAKGKGRSTTRVLRLPVASENRPQNVASTPIVGSTGNMLMPERVAGTSL